MKKEKVKKVKKSGRLSKFIVKNKVWILVISFLLLIPSVFGMINTRINYDMLNYLPSDMETIKGQDILIDEDNFGTGALSILMIEGMDDKQVCELKEKIKEIDHVKDVIWYDDFADISIPKEMIPAKYYDQFNYYDQETGKTTTILLCLFDTSTSADETMTAVKEIRRVTNNECMVTGMSALVTDLKDLCEKEEPIYVAIAVCLALVAMIIFMDNWIAPLIFLVSIGMAILYNLGTNYFLGEISYITKALSAVLQLAVTMDYSIFLWHSYKKEKQTAETKEKAMEKAISDTFTSVIGSSITTVAGFIALCFMSFTLGKDLGIVMAKGVVFGVIGVLTILPSLILCFDKLLSHTNHKSIIPDMHKPAKFITKHYIIFAVVFAILLVPSVIGYVKTEKYYDMSSNLPQDMQYVIDNSKLEDEFEIGSTHIILCDSKMNSKDATNMINEMNEVDGVKYTLGLNALIGTDIPEEVVPDSILSIVKSDEYQILLINSEYYVGSDQVNNQIDELNTILKKYDENGMLIGEAACTKDLVKVTNHDFEVVDIVSIVAIFLIIAIVLKSPTLPIVLVAVIESAIFMNLGIPYYANQSLCFIAPICISTIQLGATVDYAILLTTKYKQLRYQGLEKKDAVSEALAYAIPSIVVSALGFFAATFGVAIYSDIDIISSLCKLMARGAIISMFAVIFVLPSLLMILDKVIVHTTFGCINKNLVAANGPVINEENVISNEEASTEEAKDIVVENIEDNKEEKESDDSKEEK